MNVHLVRTDQEYRHALKTVSALFDREPEPNTPEGDWFDVMITLIETYEATHFSINLPSAIDRCSGSKE
jgi:HTH-type transcriptional regulator/antitoxin HigA